MRVSGETATDQFFATPHAMVTDREPMHLGTATAVTSEARATPNQPEADATLERCK